MFLNFYFVFILLNLIYAKDCDCPARELQRSECKSAGGTKAVEKPTFVKSVQGETAWFSGALVFDLENDGTPEVIFCYYSIFVYRVKDLKDANSLERIWKSDQGSSRTYAPCAVVDVDLDGKYEIIAARSSSVWAWTWQGDSATVLSGFPVDTKEYGDKELRGLAVRDLDGDGKSEIIATSTLGNNLPQLFVWDHKGNVYQPTCGKQRNNGIAVPHTPAWPRYNYNVAGNGNDAERNGCGHQGYGAYGLNVGVGNVDDDFELEIVATYDNHHLQVFDHDGVAVDVSKWFKNRRNECKGQRLTYGQFIRWADLDIERMHYHENAGTFPHPKTQKWLQFTQSPPNVVDLDLDGNDDIISTPNIEMDEPYDTKQIAVFAIYGAQNDSERAGERLNHWNELIGGDYPTKVDGYYPPAGPYSPVTVDIRDTPHPEIIFDGKDGFMYCIDYQAKRQWRYDYASKHAAAAPMFASEPIVVDLNADGTPEVVFSTYGNPKQNAGYLIILDNNGALLYELQISQDSKRNGNGNGAPTVSAGDIDGDGQLELILMTFEQGALIYTVNGSKLNCMVWTTSRGGRHRSGQEEDDSAREQSAATGCLPPVPTSTQQPSTTMNDLCANNVLDNGEDCLPGSGPCCKNCKFAAKGTVCRAKKIEAFCDKEDVCSGESVDCIDTFLDKGVECASGEPPCLLAANCTGESGLCPKISANSAIGNVCDDKEECTKNDKCNVYGKCEGEFYCACDGDGPSVQCDTDKNPCTIDTCENNMCKRENAPAGGVCNDFDPCTINDTCDGAGTCRGVTGCTQGCNEPNGQCCNAKCECSASFSGVTCAVDVAGCLVGAPGCPCTTGGGCDPGGVCECDGGVNDGKCDKTTPLCTNCNVGSLDCSCTAGGACDNNLKCKNGLCVNTEVSSVTRLTTTMMFYSMLALFGSLN